MKNQIIRSVVGGLVGTAVMTALMYFAAPIAIGQSMDIAAELGANFNGNWALGMAAHGFAGSIVFPLLYVFVLYRFLKGPSIVRGITWGVALWVVVQVMAVAAGGESDGGKEAAGASFIQLAATSLVVHLVYGALLGAIAGSRNTDKPQTAEAA